MSKIEELRNYLLENHLNEYGDLNLNDLDFSDFDGGVYINNMKVKGNLTQSNHEVQGLLLQYGHEVQGDLYQHVQKVKGDLHNGGSKCGGHLYETPSTKLLKEVTAEELAELGYKIKGES